MNRTFFCFFLLSRLITWTGQGGPTECHQSAVRQVGALRGLQTLQLRAVICQGGEDEVGVASSDLNTRQPRQVSQSSDQPLSSSSLQPAGFYPQFPHSLTQQEPISFVKFLSRLRQLLVEKLTVGKTFTNKPRRVYQECPQQLTQEH